MAIRRPHRSIETFDISLMAVVTKAMGAFLVLMLLLVPSYVGMPELQQQVEDIETNARESEQRVAAMKRQQEEFRRDRQDEQNEERSLIRQVAQLEGTSRYLKRLRDAPREQIASVLFMFSWAGCDGDVEFYVQGVDFMLPDGSMWPDVRAEKQPWPRGVLELRNRPDAARGQWKTDFENFATGLMGLWITEASHRPMLRAIEERAKQQAIVTVNNVPPNTRFGVYIKIRDLKNDCYSALLARVDGEEKIRDYWPKKGTRVEHLGWIDWTGTEMRGLGATPRDQAVLQEKLQRP